MNQGGDNLPRVQTCMVPRLCCRHGGRGRAKVVGPGGWLGANSCQLCTNSATSSVSFPVGITSMTTAWRGGDRRCGGFSGKAGGVKGMSNGKQGAGESGLLNSHPNLHFPMELLS